MNRQILKLLLGVFTLPACAAYQPQPLSQNHPAHGDAAPAPRQASSLTLAYTRVGNSIVRQAVWAAAATVKAAERRTADRRRRGQSCRDRAECQPDRRRARRDQRLHGRDDDGLSGGSAIALWKD